MIHLTPIREAPGSDDEIEAFYMELCLKIPEAKFKDRVEYLRSLGYRFTIGEKSDMHGFHLLAALLEISVPMVVIRMLQVYPDLKRRLAL